MKILLALKKICRNLKLPNLISKKFEKNYFFIIFFIISPYAQSKDIKCSFVTVGHFYSYSSED